MASKLALLLLGAPSVQYQAAVLALNATASTRLVIQNACDKEPIWIAHMAASGTGPEAQNLMIAAGQSHAFSTPDNLKATRYWPKMRCDSTGNRCQLGGSGGPSEICTESIGCAPPVDTKFEATFGQQGLSCDPSKQEYDGCDWIDVSMVDGWTLPFKFEIDGSCLSTSTGAAVVESQKVIDCSKVSVDECPAAESIPGAGNLDLRLRHPTTGQLVGCYSPCSKLTLRSWNNTVAAHHTPQDATSAPFCCPTPPESPAACRSGPVGKSQYVQAVHKMCPGVYGYAYDDGMGLMTCTAGATYTLSLFCPSPYTPPSPSPAPPSPSPPSPSPAKCEVGSSVLCPGTQTRCSGDACCPDGSTCPSATSSFKGCPKPKSEDCTKASARPDFVVVV